MTLWYYTWKQSQIYYNNDYCTYKSLYTSYLKVNPVKQNFRTCITWVIRTTMILNYVEKLSFSKYEKIMYINYSGQNQILKTQCSYMTIKTHESTVSIIQLYNLVKLKKWKHKYTIQFFKVESPLHNQLWQVSLKRKKLQPPSKNLLRTKKPPHHIVGGEDTLHLSQNLHFSY